MDNRNKKRTESKTRAVMVETDELTYAECYHLLRRLQFWSDLFGREAEGCARDGVDGVDLTELVADLEEKRFCHIGPNFSEVMESNLMSETDPIKLWRMARSLDNHRIAFLEKTLERFPGKKDELTHFRITYVGQSAKEKKGDEAAKSAVASVAS